MRGVIVKNRYYRDDGTDYVFARLTEELSALSADIETVDTFELLSRAELPEFAVFWDKDYVGARLLEKRGMRVFNPSEAVRICDDKYLTMTELFGEADFAETVCAPLKYPVSSPNDDKLFDTAEKLGYPLIAKFAVGSLGSGVFLIKNRTELESFHCRNADCGRIMYQKYISESSGRDIRIYTVGAKAVGAVRRSNPKSFKSNAEEGAATEAFLPKNEFIAVAERASRLLKLDYAAVDFFDTPAPIINEVNSNAYFKDAERYGKINVARRYAEHIREVVGCLKKK